MKSTLDKPTRDELVARIAALNSDCVAQWGKMNVYQMVKHCTLFEDMLVREKKYRQIFIGRLVGKMVLKQMLEKDKPMMRNAGTLRELIVTGSGDLAAEKKNLIAKVRAHENFSNEGFVHPFFGKMTKEQVGKMAYVHTDHHLRQFGC
jgi:hypothetical protein